MIGKNKGFTLIEVMVLVIVLGIVGAIAVPLLLETVDAWSFTSRYQNNAVYQAIVAMSRMSREMRRLKNDASITIANAATFTFSDLNSNLITFDQSGTALQRNTDGLADIDSVSPLTYTYYDDNEIAMPPGVVISPNTNIRRIRVAYSVLAGSNKLRFQFQTRPQNLRRLNEKFK